METSNNMINQHISRVVRILLSEFEQEKTQSGLKTNVHNISSAYKSFTGTKFEKAIYRQLLESLSGTYSNFESSPLKGCVILSVGLCMHFPEEEQHEICTTYNIAPLTIDDKTTLQKLVASFGEYTDAQIFSNSSTQDKALLELRKLISLAEITIPMYEFIYRKVCISYKQALQDTAIIRLNLVDKISQNEEKNREALAKIDSYITCLQNVQNGTQPACFIKSISYPKAVSKCVCGNCDKIINSTSFLRARSTSAEDLEYAKAFEYVLRYYGSDNLPDNPAIAKLVHNSGIIEPILCECGCVNIPSIQFIKAFKMAVLSKWQIAKPAAENNGAGLVYGANTVIEGLTDLFKNDPEVLDKTLAGMLPQIVAEKITVEEPVFDLTDLFSRESYSSYFTMLNAQISSKLLSDSKQRNIYFLQYMLSMLHIVTIGTNPIDCIHSVLTNERFKHFGDQLINLAEQISVDTPYLKRLKLIQKVFSSEYMYSNYSRYIDTVLSEDTIANVFKEIPIENIRTQLMCSDISLAERIDLISSEITRVSETLEKSYAEVQKISGKLATALYVYQQDYFNDDRATSLADLRILPGNESDLLLTCCNDTKCKLYTTDVAGILWNNISEIYPIMMYNTILHYYRSYLRNQGVFHGVFFKSLNSRAKEANKLCRHLTHSKTNLGTSEDDKMLFSEILVACIHAADSDTLLRELALEEQRILRSFIEPLPTNKQYDTVNTIQVLSEVNFPVSITEYMTNPDIEAFGQKILSKEEVSETEAVALAECAAEFYLLFGPEINKDAILQQLGTL